MVGVLLQKAIPDYPRDFNHELLIVRQHVRADQLDDLHQLVLFLQKLGNLRTAGDEIFPDVFFIPGRQVA